MINLIIRLVTHPDPLSDAILMTIGGTVAHAELILRGGTTVGAFALGGVQERPWDYDSGIFRKEILVALDVDADMAAKAEHYARACIGEPYDFTGLLEFAQIKIPGHIPHHVFCSAFVDDVLRGCEFFERPLPIPARDINPRMLHQMLFVLRNLRIVTRDDPEFVEYVSPKAE